MSDERKHLRRLDQVWLPNPVYFITTCTAGRAPRLASDDFHSIAIEVWRNCEQRYGWQFGRYVIMPDHVHFFVAEATGRRTLSDVVGKWKEWTAKYAARRLNFAIPLWQPEFFDHVLRTTESYEEKWEYTLANPKRAGLVNNAEDWKYQGELNVIKFD